jgi:hypothetical protein
MPAIAQKTANRIKGVKHNAMLELGHFLTTENPGKFVPHLLEVIKWI